MCFAQKSIHYRNVFIRSLLGVRMILLGVLLLHHYTLARLHSSRIVRVKLNVIQYNCD